MQALPPCFAILDHATAQSVAWLTSLPRECGVLVRASKNRTQLRLLAKAAKAQRRWLLIGGDWRIAHQLGLGYHASSMRLRHWFRSRPLRPTSAAVHNLPALWRAKKAGADFALLSPVFATATHPTAQLLGIKRFAALLRQSPLPLYALGGITATTWQRLNGINHSALLGFATRSGFA